jgi:hypothetical protein
MNLKNLLKNRIYIYPAKEFIIKDENFNIIENILKNADFNFNIENNVEFLDSNYDFDVYKFHIGERDFVLKYSLNDSDNLLKDEFNLIADINSDLLQIPFKNNTFKYGDYISYSIYSFENEISLKENGDSYFLNNYELFFDCLTHVNEKPISKYNIDDIILKFLNDYKIENLTIHDLESIKDDIDINLIDSFLQKIKNEIKFFLSKVKDNNKSLCHGNLTNSNILCGDDYYKFINFTNSFNCHEYYDICDTFFNLRLPLSFERDYFFAYLKYKKINFEPKEWELYKNYYNIIIRKRLIEYIFALIYEKYILFFNRPIKIYSIVNNFTLNSDHFLKIPAFKENYKYITNLYSSLILQQ